MSESGLMRQRWKKEDYASDLICGTREKAESNMKSGLWMVEERETEELGEMLLKEREGRSRLDLEKYIRTKLERLSLRNIGSHYLRKEGEKRGGGEI